MGNSKYLDNLNKGERQALINKLWTQQNHKCFICGKDIDLDLQPVDIDHIKPLVNNGKDDPSNFGITHDHCNRSKKDADLVIARWRSFDNKECRQAFGSCEMVMSKRGL
jgi:5-methylcytosine-specific restriction endonuclease McrA